MRSFPSNSLPPPLSPTEIRRIVADEVAEQIRRYHNRNRLVFYNIPEDINMFTQATFIRRILELEVCIPMEQGNHAFTIVRRLGKQSEDRARPLIVDIKDLPMPSLKELARKMNDPTVEKDYYPDQIMVRKMETQQQRKEGFLKRKEFRKNHPKEPPKEESEKVLPTAEEHFIVKSETTHEPVSIPVSAEYYKENEDIPQAEFCMPNGFLHPALIEGTAENMTLNNFNNPIWRPSKPNVKATREELLSWNALNDARNQQWNKMRRNSDYYDEANQLMRESVQYYYDNDNFHRTVPRFVNDWKNKNKVTQDESQHEM